MNSRTTDIEHDQPADVFADAAGVDLPDDQPGAAQPISPHAVAVPRGATGEVTTGIAMMVIFTLIAPGIDIFAKLATAHVPSAEVAAMRFAVQFIALTPIVLWRGGLAGLTGGMLAIHAVRGALIGAATIFFITALSHMPVADAIAIFFIEPMVLTLLGGVFLGEKVGWRRYLASFVGFIGAMIVVRPSFQELGPVALLPIGTAFTFAIYLILTRRMAAREDPFTMQAFAGFFGTLFVGLILWFGNGSGSAVLDPIWPDHRGWWLMLGVGVMATISHLFLVYAFRKAPASVLAPLQYLEIVTATIFGFLVFSDFPDALKWLGIAIIVASGLFIFWRERLAAERDRMG
ncbi:MAG: DMT family transporter [Nitratireductor sp.]|nr:DMT family transporter [Nitratireductor sp.]